MKRPTYKTAPLHGTYSLWLRPEPAAYERLQGLISWAAERYDAPRFSPHATLLGGVVGEAARLVDSTRALAKSLDPIPLGAVGLRWYPRAWNQDVLLELESTEQLVAARRLARDSFDAGAALEFPPPSRAPHASIIYGNASSSSLAELRERDATIEELRYVFVSLELWRTEGGLAGVPAWSEVASFPLGGAS